MQRNRGLKSLICGAMVTVALAFGLTPPASALSAIDVSSHQTGIDLVAAGTDINIIKATQGTWYTNPDCDRAVQQSLSAGRATGVYHFVDFSGSAQAEADRFISETRGYIGRGIMPILDWEPSQPWRTDYAKAWLDRVQAAYGVKPLIYMNISTENSYDWSSVVQGDYGLWIAGGWWYNTRLGKDQAPAPNWALRHWPHAAMWQYTSHGVVQGWGGNVDLSEFYGDMSAWNRYSHGSASPAPVAAPAPVQIAQGTYTVRPGDCLSLIAPRVGMDWRTLANLNGVRPPAYVIYPGQVLRTTPGHVSGGSHVVAPGDTLSGVAARYGVAQGAIHGYRSGNPNIIYPGEVLTW